MICVSLGNLGFEQCKAVLEKIELAEIRLDKTSFTIMQIADIFSLPVKLIATFRPGDRNLEDRKKALLAAIQAGAGYVDIELEAPVSYREEISREARSRGCGIIVSYHDYNTTPAASELAAIVRDCFNCSADIAKVACQVRSEAECARIISLYESFQEQKGKLIALGMGEKGRLTRLAAPLLGAPFTFAALYPAKETAPGQLDKESLEKILAILKS